MKASYVRDCAQGRWPEILESLGINPKHLKNKHGACPICGGKDRFRFDDKEQHGTFFCNQCGAGDGLKLLQLFGGWSFPYTLETVARLLQIKPGEPKHISHYIKKNEFTSSLSTKETRKRQKYLNLIWQDAKPISTNDPVDCYLRSRGIKLNSFPSALRYHPNLPYYEESKLIGTFPAMLASVTNENNQLISIHRTYLTKNGKANVPSPKKIMRPAHSISGAAIKLSEPHNGFLAVAEGIETALAFQILYGIPSWSTLTANGMEKIIFPEEATNIFIAADNDSSGRGQAAALTLFSRLIKEGRTVKTITPHNVDIDFADVLAGGLL